MCILGTDNIGVQNFADERPALPDIGVPPQLANISGKVKGKYCVSLEGHPESGIQVSKHEGERLHLSYFGKQGFKDISEQKPGAQIVLMWRKDGTVVMVQIPPKEEETESDEVKEPPLKKQKVVKKEATV